MLSGVIDSSLNVVYIQFELVELLLRSSNPVRDKGEKRAGKDRVSRLND